MLNLNESKPNFFVPRFHCDLCGAVIKDATAANVIHQRENFGAFNVVHKQCDSAFHKSRPAVSPAWLGLDEFLALLLENSGLTQKQLDAARRRTKNWNQSF